MAEEGTVIDKLSINITANANSAINSIDKLGNVLRRLKYNANDIDSVMRQIADSISILGDATTEEAAANITRLVYSLERLTKLNFGNLKDASRFFNSLSQISLSNLSDFADADFGAIQNGVFQLVNTFDRINQGAIDKMYKLSSALKRLSNVGEQLSAIGNLDVGISAPANITLPNAKEFTKLLDSIKGSDLEKKFAEVQTPIANFVKALEPLIRTLDDTYKGLANVDKELRQKPKDAKGATESVNRLNSGFGKLGATFKRLVLYRTLRSAIQAVVNGIKEGLGNAYQFAKLVGHDMAGSLDRMASASLKMKNQLGSAFGEILRAVEPVVIKILQFITWIADGISRVMAIFNGSDTYLQAQDIETAWGGATEGVKEYKRQLLGLDELNVLNSTNSNSGNGATDVSKMFKEVAVDSGISKDTFEKLKNAADALKNAVSLVISLVSSEGFQKLLGLITDVLSAAFIGSLNAFGDFCQIVEGLLNGDWNKFWNGFDNLGEHLATAIDSIGFAIADFFGIDWKQFKDDLGVWVGDLQDGIAEFFNGLKESIMETSMKIFSNPALKTLIKAFTGLDIDKTLNDLGYNSDGTVKKTTSETLSNFGNFFIPQSSTNIYNSSFETYANNKLNNSGSSGSQPTVVKVEVDSDGLIVAQAKKTIEEAARGLVGNFATLFA